MSGISAIAAVQARVGSIETRLGLRRPAVSTAPSNTTSTPTSTSTATTGATTASLATVLAAYGIDASGIDLSSLDGVTGTMGTTSTGTTSTGTVDTGNTFDAVMEQVAGSTPSIDGTVGEGTPYAALFNAAGAKYGVPPRVLAAIGYVESRFHTDSVSSAGAVGMMQFLPSTAASMGVDPTDPASAVDGAARYLRSAIDRFGNLDMAIAAYNVGPGAVAASGIQPGSQAEKYTNAVLTATGRIS